ncbi:MAG: insulinase family protein, partial [Lachnospiraceae bacterium]|nr:insulinase family protein [Lachnospiraceae bacterium]
MDMKKIPAYELIQQETIQDIQSVGYLLRHKKSGARVMVLENDDDNKVFNIAFRTTPTNSTGVAHIMEHSVLCGSRRFPSKDPFVELVKGSMNTFLNAMTYPDKTMFPVASCNDADFHNLIQVYLDAVFFPNIYQKEEIFRQEGWSYQIENPEDDLVYNGVVYNEMKGAYSSPEDVLEQQIMSSLFPDTTYFWESGGDPENIPDLSYEEFLAFHKKYYHPSNSYIYLYGNMEAEKHLNWMDQEYLGRFENETVDSEIRLQKPFKAPVEVHREYSITQGDTREDNTFLAYNVAVGTSLDTRLASAFAVLEYALLEAPGAPLKEALLDAGIGKDIMSSYDSGTRQPVFSIIAKNANEEDQERFCRLIRQELGRLAKEGVDKNAILAAVNIMEFKFREADYGGFPKGLMYGIDVFDSWLYDDTRPFDYLRQLADFDFLKQQAGTDYYETLIRKWILENPHTSVVVIAPKKGLTAEMEQEVADRLKKKKEQMSQAQVLHLIEKTKQLRAFQETPSTQEELQMIPMLSRADLKKEAAPLKNEVHNWNGNLVLRHDYQTNGIAYMTILLNASGVSREDLPYLGILKNVIGMVDTQHYSYGELYNQINQNTGGITPGISVFPNEKEPDHLKAAFGIQVRTLYDKMEYSFRMIEEMLFTSNLEQEKRLEEIL